MHAHEFAAIFCSGDLTETRQRPRYIGQFFVVSLCARDPVRAVNVYRELQCHGVHAAERFRAMLAMQRDSPFSLWWHEVYQRRRIARLPA